MEVPEGIDVGDSTNVVFKLNKALNLVKQAPRQRNMKQMYSLFLN